MSEMMQDTSRKVVTVKRRIANKQQQVEGVEQKEEKKQHGVVRKMGTEPQYDKETNSYQWSKKPSKHLYSMVENRLKQQHIT